ncbi:EGF-like domain-containing protein [Artemisia annua]|uniref:EGF-like domain-containing protein n=1 Tax=Artemisia annua TaxID=35608 RepID=A0A2U1Q2F1_ARTAN|nr:EGF-like domain-containing protein [Artemisia annua]
MYTNTNINAFSSFLLAIKLAKFGPADSYKHPKLFIGSTSIEVYNISDSELHIFTDAAYKCYSKDGDASMNARMEEPTIAMVLRLILLGVTIALVHQDSLVMQTGTPVVNVTLLKTQNLHCLYLGQVLLWA